MKLFRVRIDNNPGGWKSGEDPHMLVFAKDKEEAIQKVRDGWNEKWDYNNNIVTLTYGENFQKEFSIVSEESQLSASEIKFDGYDIHIKPTRKAKLDRIEKNSKRYDEEK